MPTVTLLVERYTVGGHLGSKAVTNYEIYLNDVRLRGFSTHGNMAEGFWGCDAQPQAEKYANAVARTLGVRVVRARTKEKPSAKK